MKKEKYFIVGFDGYNWQLLTPFTEDAQEAMLWHRKYEMEGIFTQVKIAKTIYG